MSTYAYLASPYSHPDPQVRQRRYEEAMQAIAVLMRSGIPAISPIVHSHPLAQQHHLPTDAEAWLPLNRALIEHAAALYVLEAEGWRTSAGVQWEIGEALRLAIPVHHVTPTSHAPALITTPTPHAGSPAGLLVIIETVLDYWGVPLAVVRKHSRRIEVANARHLASYFGRASGHTWSAIARVLHCDDTTARYGALRIEGELRTDGGLCEEVERIRALVAERVVGIGRPRQEAPMGK